MKHIKQDWRKRSLIIMVVSLIVSALLWTLSFTDWAVAMNSVTAVEPHEPREAPPALLMMVMPLFKVTMLTVVPATLCVVIMRVFGWIKGMVKTGVHMQQ
jgi:flagellar basal body-associated protein FliL